ncbi:MAG: hypothetical protein AAGJ82_09205 [Bacteroidota bacterium]
MNRLVTTFCLFLLGLQLAFAQVAKSNNRSAGQVALNAAFYPLINQTWYAKGQWNSGADFEQHVTFFYGVAGNIVLADTRAYLDEERTQWGRRSHGVRYWDTAKEALAFTEYDAFGGITNGEVEAVDGIIYYHYTYGDQQLTDAWERVDDNRYRLRVGIMRAGEWIGDLLLDTYFQNEPFAEDTAENTLPPYAEIPPAPEAYNACTVAARAIDGLGFRYYWATQGLTPQDLAYRPSRQARTSGETLDHIYGLAEMIHNAVTGLSNVRPETEKDWTIAEQRAATLRLLQTASNRLRTSHPAEMENFKVIFQRGEMLASFPFWNTLNGPLGDALWHTGQVVLMRRASGNPLNSKVNVFRGKGG